MGSAGRRGGALAWVIGALCFAAAALTLAWMLLLPAAVQSRFAAATGGADLALRGLAGDPFAGRATVTGWTLRATASPSSPVLASGGPSSLLAPGWREALGAAPGSAATIDEIDLHVAEARLAPDTKGRWQLLSLAAAAGLPYERGGAIGDGPRVRVRRLRLRVDTLLVLDGNTGRETRVAVAWRGEFTDLDHLRPVVAALFEAVRVASASGASRP